VVATVVEDLTMPEDDDKKLPALRGETLPANRRDEGASKPTTTVGRWFRGQLSRVDTKSLKNTTGAVDAFTDLEIAKGKLADAKAETTRKIDRLRYDLPSILHDDRQQTQHQIALNQQRRAREAAQAHAQTERARRNERTAQTDREIADTLASKARDKAAALFDAEKYDALGQMRRAQHGYESKWGDSPDGEHDPSDGKVEALLNTLAVLEDQIAKEKDRGATAAELAPIETTVARIKAELYDLQQKNQPE
jgi:hypothetical protein